MPRMAHRAGRVDELSVLDAPMQQTPKTKTFAPKEKARLHKRAFRMGGRLEMFFRPHV